MSATARSIASAAAPITCSSATSSSICGAALPSEEVSEFPILEELKQEGMTDYLAYVHSFEPFEEDGRAQGMMGSWATDRPGGFIDADIAALLKIQSHLALVSKMAVLKRLAGNVLTTYLGGDAGPARDERPDQARRRRDDPRRTRHRRHAQFDGVLREARPARLYRHAR